MSAENTCLTNADKVGPSRFVARRESVDHSSELRPAGLVQPDKLQQQRRESTGTAEQDNERTNCNVANNKAKNKTNKTIKRKRAFNRLSFDFEEQGPHDEKPMIKRAMHEKPLKNPHVDTSFLPDREREASEHQMREKIKNVWHAEQDKIKAEEIEVVYSYWDGRGHRRHVTCQKGTTIFSFLELCRKQVPELRSVTSERLMYIKEDIIIPHHYTFYDLLVTRARGKSGPLFHFDVHEDVRLRNDASREKDESHAGKVVKRDWYEKHRDIFPANRWEVYDPTKEYGSYGIKDV
ncbi:hypothetical protein MGL_0238 [Malassezia globosa CBS 7966]|uniref:FAM50A/XAP5 C-terminal domain-containing protein n=1 Tax=Malassezia globosa (strain ATCC MYA-4612 / CBS 7966) TaxID=425265 RepID=A8PSD6_MALGO|nr:uncharacterized protein MGL_0238 [Malassezia globosa CBS 7966]EDP45249.1 hypothetical protein MGL_0238 [Malassezia globosa CBS 7966]